MLRYLMCAVLLVSLCGCQKHPKVVAKSRKRLATLQAVYKTKVLDRLPGPAQRKIIQCEPGAVKEPEKQIPVVQDEFLKKIVDPNAKTRKSKYLPKSLGTSAALRRMAMDPKYYPLSFQRHLDMVEPRRYLGVFLTEKWQQGEVENRKIVRPARFKGWFSLFDLKTGKIVTQFPVHVRSARYMTVWRRKGYKANWGRAFRKSVSSGLGQWTNKYLKRYCPVVTVDSNPN